MKGSIVGIVGLQGVGKSHVLMMLSEFHKIEGESNEVIFFKWRRESDILKSLLGGNHEASIEFLFEYRRRYLDDLGVGPRQLPGAVSVSDIESFLGNSEAEKLQRAVWINILQMKKLILIDTPDYSKTDRRLMAKDLEGIYWIWNFVTRHNAEANIVVAIQKEMFRDHFFFDKMEKVELEPLKPEQMVEAYRKRFKVIDPFTEDALLNLARMSRGIFRRFLRYITLTLRRWEICGKGPIDTAIVKEAVPVARLAEDMETELAELFPKHSDLRLLAVRLLMLLEESGERKQIELAGLLEVEPYVLSRLLTKLEVAHYITRRRAGNDKIVDLRIARNNNQTPQVLDRAIAVM